MFTVLGNCQTTAIADGLLKSEEFFKEYELLRIPPVHTISHDKQKDYFNRLRDIDLILTQPITDHNRFPFLNNDIVKSSTKKNIITFPSAYYSGYFPTYESVDFLKGSMHNVHDYLVMKAFLENKSSDETLYLKDNLGPLSDTFIFNQHINSIASLHRRELNSKSDIFLSSFIIENFRTNKLFHTFNHPTEITLNHLINEILSKIGIKKSTFTCHNKPESLGHIRIPINKRIKEILGLSFAEDSINVDDEDISTRKHIEEDFKLYSTVDRNDLSVLIDHKKAFLSSLK